MVSGHESSVWHSKRLAWHTGRGSARDALTNTFCLLISSDLRKASQSCMMLCSTFRLCDRWQFDRVKDPTALDLTSEPWKLWMICSLWNVHQPFSLFPIPGEILILSQAIVLKFWLFLNTCIGLDSEWHMHLKVMRAVAIPWNSSIAFWLHIIPKSRSFEKLRWLVWRFWN